MIPIPALPITPLRAAIAGCLALTVVAGVQTWRLHSEQADHASTAAAWATERAALADAARRAEAGARATEQRRIAAAQEAANHAHDQLDHARADLARAADAGSRLRDALAAARAGCRLPAEDPAASAGSAPAQAPADLFADVQRRLDAAADRIAEYADAAGIAGAACERIHEGVSAP